MLVTVALALVAIGVLTREMASDPATGQPAVAAEAAALGMVNERGRTSIAPGVRLDALKKALPALLEELLKQTVDQTGHLLIAAIPIWLSRRLTGVPWYGWAAIPLLGWREWLQWPSNRWWDPPLDWAFLALGVLAATWALSALRRPGTPRP